MPRIASALLVVGLLVATSAAFAVTERLKLVRSPVTQTQLDRGLFSPTCRCETDTVEIGFRLRKTDRLTLTVVDASGRPVRTLIDQRRHAGPVTARWNGRDDFGSVVPEGTYKPRVHLARERRTIELPNPMRVDTTPPRVLSVAARPQAFSPDGDGRRDKVSVRYRLGETGKALLYVDGEPRVTGRGQGTAGKLDWFGHDRDRGLRPGRYELSIVAIDRAGNQSAPSAAVAVTIRYIELSRRTIRVRDGARFSVRVRSDARLFTWRLRGGRGASRPGTLVLRAPRRRGRYALVVEENGRKARATVIVERRRAG